MVRPLWVCRWGSIVMNSAVGDIGQVDFRTSLRVLPTDRAISKERLRGSNLRLLAERGEDATLH
jgi:hypothetical protein